ncbi:hypothetical protein HMPREF9005_1537 [Actinomyces sp. oral taxon 178 str. F0338]|nr:hypothetical protein HMPREF9005_1537 [Actinomyces sp. oral taxon 178 str. F0338]
MVGALRGGRALLGDRVVPAVRRGRGPAGRIVRTNRIRSRRTVGRSRGLAGRAAGRGRGEAGGSGIGRIGRPNRGGGRGRSPVRRLARNRGRCADGGPGIGFPGASGGRPTGARGLAGHSENPPHEGCGMLVGRVGGQDSAQVGDGLRAPPVNDEQFGQVHAQRQVLRPFCDNGHEGVDQRIRHAPSLPTGKAGTIPSALRCAPPHCARPHSGKRRSAHPHSGSRRSAPPTARARTRLHPGLPGHSPPRPGPPGPPRRARHPENRQQRPLPPRRPRLHHQPGHPHPLGPPGALRRSPRPAPPPRRRRDGTPRPTNRPRVRACPSRVERPRPRHAHRDRRTRLWGWSPGRSPPHRPRRKRGPPGREAASRRPPRRTRGSRGHRGRPGRRGPRRRTAWPRAAPAGASARRGKPALPRRPESSVRRSCRYPTPAPNRSTPTTRSRQPPRARRPTAA